MTGIDITAVAVQAALIAGILALAGTLVNIFSTWLIRLFDRATKRDDWILEKQARDVEEIVLSLDRFLKTLSESDSELRSRSFNLESLLQRQLAYQRQELNLHVVEPSFLTELERQREGLRQLLEKTGEMSSLYTWFHLDSVRLSTWFRDPARTRQELSSLGMKYFRVEIELNNYAFDLLRLCLEFQRNVPTLSERDKETVLNKQKEMEELTAKHVQLITETEKAQKTLIAELRFKSVREWVMMAAPIHLVESVRAMLRPK